MGSARRAMQRASILYQIGRHAVSARPDPVRTVRRSERDERLTVSLAEASLAAASCRSVINPNQRLSDATWTSSSRWKSTHVAAELKELIMDDGRAREGGTHVSFVAECPSPSDLRDDTSRGARRRSHRQSVMTSSHKLSHAPTSRLLYQLSCSEYSVLSHPWVHQGWKRRPGQEE
jgi:hypothetical protein